MLIDLDTLKWLLAFLSPAIVGFWAWWIARQTAREKRTTDSFSYNQARDASMRAFGEGIDTNATSQLAEITSQALQQNYKLNDGMLTRMFEAVTAGNISQAEQQLKVMDAIERVVSSVNKSIEQQAALLDLFSEMLGRTTGDQKVSSDMLKTALMISTSDQQAADAMHPVVEVKK